VGRIRGNGPVADRLRAFVRERVHKDGSQYVRGAAAALAKRVHKAPSWVSTYVDVAPTTNADIDTALAICDFFGVSIEDFRDGRTTPAAILPPHKPVRGITRAVKMLELMDEPRRRRAVSLLADLFLAAERARLQQSPRQSVGTSAATKHTRRGIRRGEE
jgi:hypothetical protein